MTVYSGAHGPSDSLFSSDKLDYKTSDNIRRAQRMVEAYALCNVWEWFCTFTLDPVKYNRNDLDKFRSDFTRWVRNLRRIYPDIKFLLVPELHHKGGWHMHGLLSGIPPEAFRLFTLEEQLPYYIRSKLKLNQSVYDWPKYREKFGFVDIEPVRSRDACSRYITKYITKDIDNSSRCVATQKHLYFVSRGLNLPVRLECENAPGTIPSAFPMSASLSRSFDYVYGTVQWFQT